MLMDMIMEWIEKEIIEIENMFRINDAEKKTAGDLLEHVEKCGDFSAPELSVMQAALSEYIHRDKKEFEEKQIIYLLTVYAILTDDGRKLFLDVMDSLGKMCEDPLKRILQG